MVILDNFIVGVWFSRCGGSVVRKIRSLLRDFNWCDCCVEVFGGVGIGGIKMVEVCLWRVRCRKRRFMLV